MACIGDFYYTYLPMTKFKEVEVEIAVTEKKSGYLPSLERKYHGICLKKSAQGIAS